MNRMDIWHLLTHVLLCSLYAVDRTTWLLLNSETRVAVVHTCCVAGTHRSVAAAEIIAQELQRRGVRITHVTHVHRVEGWAERVRV
jgi:RNase adaptor protein for sRNA GlmZ degradation